MSAEKIINSAKQTLQIEANGIQNLIQHLDENFVKCIQAILNSKGRIVVTGIGKSANIANKIVATLNSTGTPAIFMHAADAIHGDLGLVQRDDMVMCLSKSGNTPEIKVLIPLIQKSGNLIIGMTANKESVLGQKSDFLIHTPIEQEACPNGLAPTTSTTAQLAMGDAIAVALIEVRGFSSEDFAKYHPGGSLGKRLYLKISDILDEETPPKVEKDASIKKVIMEMTVKRLGSTAVVDGSAVIGMITDGDLRRMLQKHDNLESITASDVMSPKPLTIEKNELAIVGFKIMDDKNITQLIVVEDDHYKGIIHLHDLLREGIY